MRVGQRRQLIQVITSSVPTLHRIRVDCTNFTMEYNSTASLFTVIFVTVFMGHMVFRKTTVLVIEFHAV